MDTKTKEPARKKKEEPAANKKDAPKKKEPAAITFQVQRREVRLLWALVALTIWLTVVLHAGQPVAWLIAAVVTMTGAWAQQGPARRPAEILIRGLVLVFAGFLLEGVPGRVSEWNFMWPLAVLTLYSLVLPRGWVHVLWLAGAVSFVSARLLWPAGTAWQTWLLQAGVLTVFAYGAFAFADSVRVTDRVVESTRRDDQSRLYNDAGFFSHGSELFDECKRHKQPFSLLLLSSADLRELADLAGRRAANELFAQLVSKIEAATPPKGLAARTDSQDFALALPGLPAVKAAALLQQQLGTPPSVEARLKGRRVKVVLDMVAAESTADVAALEDMYDRLRSSLSKRAGPAAVTEPGDLHSTLAGMLDADPPVPQFARPTMPMGYGDSLPMPVMRRS